MPGARACAIRPLARLCNFSYHTESITAQYIFGTREMWSPTHSFKHSTHHAQNLHFTHTCCPCNWAPLKRNPPSQSLSFLCVSKPPGLPDFHLPHASLQGAPWPVPKQVVRCVLLCHNVVYSYCTMLKSVTLHSPLTPDILCADQEPRDPV